VRAIAVAANFMGICQTVMARARFPAGLSDTGPAIVIDSGATLLAGIRAGAATRAGLPGANSMLQWPVCTSRAPVESPAPVRLPLRGQLGFAQPRGGFASRFPFIPRPMNLWRRHQRPEC
jgi:hypothetical protein